jgi:hypothetical protein
MTSFHHPHRHARRPTFLGHSWLFYLSLCFFLLSLVIPTATADNNMFYPEDHWKYSTQITDLHQLESLIQSELETGRTLFVRWIASPL